jgi:hypothetical protein
MIILECKNIPKLEEYLVVTNKRCYIQEVTTVVLTEYNIPILFDDGEPLEVYISMDEYLVKLLKKYRTVKVFKTFLDFGNVNYIFEETESVLQTSVPELSCICTLPEINYEHQVVLQVDDCLKINFDNVEYRIPTLYSKKSSEIIIHGPFLPSGFCKVYIAENMPLVLEMNKKLIYIAPIE